MQIRLSRFAGMCGLMILASSALGAPTGLNTIPTTDTVPYHSWVGQLQNSNTSFRTPTLFKAPYIFAQSQFALTSKIEAGADLVPSPDDHTHELVLNIKTLLMAEDDVRPNAAFGISNLANHFSPAYYLTFSKTLNYGQVQHERFRAHHRRNRKLLGRRIHAGLFLVGQGALEPFLGSDFQISETTVLQTDWIAGPGNAFTFGFIYILPDQRTILNPSFLFSNDNQKVDGFFLNISHQFNL